MNYPGMIVALIEHFIVNEGTDYLGDKGQPEDGPEGLTSDEQLELGRLRDMARKNVGWHGYE